MFFSHAGENRHSELFETPGFRVALPRTVIRGCWNDNAFLLRTSVAGQLDQLSRIVKMKGLAHMLSVSLIQ